MSNSNFSNNPGQENYRGRSNNERSNFRDRSGGRRDGGGFRIRLSDNEMKAVKSIQETFQLRSTVAVLGFAIRTLSEMIKDEKLIESITEYAKNNKRNIKMSNSNFSNNPGQENYRGRSNNERSNFRDRSGGRRDGGGFRIRLSDNEMKAVKSIQETFQLRSTVAVLGFSVRTLSEMIKNEKLIESITEYAKNN